MRAIIIVVCAAAMAGVVVTGCRDSRRTPVQLGDSDSILLLKMDAIKARNITSMVSAQLYRQVSGEQKCYWFELQDRTIVAVLVTGPSQTELRVSVIEIGKPGTGMAGIDHWRGQKLTRYSSIPPEGLEK